MDVTTDTFEQEVLKSAIPVLDFWGPACGPCLALMPQVEKLLSGNEDKIKLTMVDASKNRRLCLNLRVLGLPTFLLYQDGQEVVRLTGQDLRIEQIAEAVRKVAG
jgi:thioredoxin 1